MCCEVTSAWYWCVQTWSYPGVYRSDAFYLTQGYNDQIWSCLRGSTIPRRYRAVRSGHTWWKSYLSLCSLSLTIVFLSIFNPAFTIDTSNDITPAIRVVAFMKKKRVLRKSFRDVLQVCLTWHRDWNDVETLFWKGSTGRCDTQIKRSTVLGRWCCLHSYWISLPLLLDLSQFTFEYSFTLQHKDSLKKVHVLTQKWIQTWIQMYCLPLLQDSWIVFSPWVPYEKYSPVLMKSRFALSYHTCRVCRIPRLMGCIYDPCIARELCLSLIAAFVAMDSII